MRIAPLAAAVFVVLSTAAQAKTQVKQLPVVEVTTSKRPEPVDIVPAGVSVVPARELQVRGASDLGSALALVPGVQAPSGGDAGPSSAVPAFWGLHEFDAFLLVVDGVPWGGAFNPMITTLDLNNVERIEVLKGAAPVMYGATSFVGVVQALHYPAGQASNTVSLAYGNRGSWDASAALVLPKVGRYRQSLAIDGQRLGFADRRESTRHAQVLYRGALDMDKGTLGIDASLNTVRDVPPSPINREGPGLSPDIPINANFNPADARIDQTQSHLALRYTRDTAWGEWKTTASMTHSHISDIRAFLHPDLTGTADTQNQKRRIDDDYFDTHLVHPANDRLDLIVGADVLHGYATQTSLNSNDAYTVPLDGSVLPPSTSALPVNEIGVVRDRRNFMGQYAQLDWRPTARWDITGGLRLNETRESKYASDLAPPDPFASESNARRVVKPTVSAGASYRFWHAGPDMAVAYADVRTAYKPAAIDFGPDYQPAVLRPETTRSVEAGLKGTALDGSLDWKAAGFLVNFRNLVVPSPSGSLVNAGGERLRGTEFEARWHAAPDLELIGNLAIHDARYTEYLFSDPDTNTVYNLAGKRLPMSPRMLASAGILYTPDSGLYATLTSQYVGRRYLDERNTASVGGFASFAATLGYRFRDVAVSLEGRNLGNRRPPVSLSEFGSDAFYLLNARSVWLRLTYHLAPPAELD